MFTPKENTLKAITMKYKESLATKLCITDVKGLDHIIVYLENFNAGQGKLTITISGDAWSHYWSHMGSHTLEDFILSADNHYLSKKLATQAELSESYYEGFIDNIKLDIIENRKHYGSSKKDARALWEKLDEIEPYKGWFEDSGNQDLLHELGGEEYWYLIPSVDSDTYKYLCKILNAIRDCLKLRISSGVSGL